MTIARPPTTIVRESSDVKRHPQNLRPSPEDIATRNRMAEDYLPLVRRLCKRFYGSGEPLEDLNQVGSMGLVKAVARYDSSRGVSLVSYATPVILGEIKNHLRDHGWAVKVPRKVKTNRMAVNRTVDSLTLALGRAPTIPDIARATGLSEEEVYDTFEVAKYGKPLSLDAEYDGNGSGDVSTLLDYLGSEDPQFGGFGDRMDIENSASCLDRRERTIICLKFYVGLTQTEIARQLNISHMHVSRLQRAALSKLKEQLTK